MRKSKPKHVKWFHVTLMFPTGRYIEFPAMTTANAKRIAADLGKASTVMSGNTMGVVDVIISPKSDFPGPGFWPYKVGQLPAKPEGKPAQVTLDPFTDKLSEKFAYAVMWATKMENRSATDPDGNAADLAEARRVLAYLHSEMRKQGGDAAMGMRMHQDVIDRAIDSQSGAKPDNWFADADNRRETQEREDAKKRMAVKRGAKVEEDSWQKKFKVSESEDGARGVSRRDVAFYSTLQEAYEGIEGMRKSKWYGAFTLHHLQMNPRSGVKEWMQIPASEEEKKRNDAEWDANTRYIKTQKKWAEEGRAKASDALADAKRRLGEPDKNGDHDMTPSTQYRIVPSPSTGFGWFTVEKWDTKQYAPGRFEPVSTFRGEAAAQEFIDREVRRKSSEERLARLENVADAKRRLGEADESGYYDENAKPGDFLRDILQHKQNLRTAEELEARKASEKRLARLEAEDNAARKRIKNLNKENVADAKRRLSMPIIPGSRDITVDALGDEARSSPVHAELDFRNKTGVVVPWREPIGMAPVKYKGTRFDSHEHWIGEHYAGPLINGDYSGLDFYDDEAGTDRARFVSWVTRNSVPAGGHWDVTEDVEEFYTDEVTGLKSKCVKAIYYYEVK